MPDSPLSDTPPVLSDADWYRLIRSQIEFEASLITQRLSWFVGAQAFLFSAYAITLNAPTVPATQIYADQQHLLFYLIPVVAISSGSLIYFTILSAHFSQRRLRRFLARRLPPERLALFPSVQGGQYTHRVGMTAPIGLPVIFVIVWGYLFIHGFMSPHPLI